MVISNSEDVRKGKRAMNDDQPIEYDAINFDGLERRANYRTVTYRIDMLHICDHKDAAATLYGIIYRWQFEVKRAEVLREIDRRKKAGVTPLTQEEAESMMWVYMSYNDFVRETGGAIGYNTVIRLIDYLVNDIKAIEQQENSDTRFADYMYRINKKVVRPLLKALPVEPAFAPKIPKKKPKSTQMGTANEDSTHLGIPDNQSTHLGTDSTQEGIASTQMGTEVYPNGGTSHTTHILHTYNNTEEDSFAADAPTLTYASLLDDLTEDDLKIDEEDITDAPTVRMPVVKKPTSLTPKPAQETPSRHFEQEPEQAAPVDENETHSQQPEQQALMVAPPRQSAARQAPKWTAEVMVAKAEELRGRPYSKITRPKEVRAAEKLFKRKEDITPEEFERVFVHRNDPWWHEHCGLLNVTDLAATPNGKNDMRYMLELEKIEREDAREQESETKKSAPRSPAQDRVISSFGTPGFDFAAEFYPSEAEKRAAYATAQW